MNRRSLVVSICLFAFLALEVTSADAWPWRRRRRTNYNYYTGNSNSSYLRFAPKVDPKSTEYGSLGVSYGYSEALASDVAFADQIRVHMWVWDKQILESDDDLVAEVKLTDLSDSSKTHVKYYPVTIRRDAPGDQKPAHFVVTNDENEDPIVQPAKVYRLYVNLHRESQKYGKESVLGKVRKPYYVATSGKSRLEQARQQIAIRTFKEFYYTEMGWPSRENYWMDCHAYYLWATSFCTVGAQNDQASLWRLFDAETPYKNGTEVPELSKKVPVHGDYVRISGHTFMILTYDRATEMVWTMEGNMGATIEVCQRTPDGSWTVGHLVDKHIRRDMFAVARDNGDQEIPTSRVEAQ